MLNNNVAGLMPGVSGNASLVKSYSLMLNFEIYMYKKYKNLEYI